MKTLRIILSINMILVLSLYNVCFAEEGRRLYGKGKYEFERRDSSTYTITVGEYSKVKAPLQNPVIFCPGAIPSEYIIVEVHHNKPRKRK